MTTNTNPSDYANLIAAAPKLLEAARFAVKIMLDWGNAINWPVEMPMSYAEAINQLNAAIARAEGKPQ
jgi:hypothetical protein